MRYFLCFIFTICFAQKIAINSASFEEIRSLPLTDSQSESLYEFVLYHGPIENI